MRVVGDGSEGAAAVAAFASGVALLPAGSGLHRDAHRLAQPAARPAVGVQYRRGARADGPRVGREQLEPPLGWSAEMVDEWMTDLRAVRGVRASTLRAARSRRGCSASTPPTAPTAGPRSARSAFAATRCRLCTSGTAPCTFQDAEEDPARRACTRTELQGVLRLCRRACRRRARRRAQGLAAAFRDATLFEVAYAYGLRRNEVRMLDVADFGARSYAAAFGDYGVCYIRHETRP